MSAIWPELGELGIAIKAECLPGLAAGVRGIWRIKNFGETEQPPGKKTPGLNGVCDLTALDDDEVAALMAKIDVGSLGCRAAPGGAATAYEHQNRA
jgi:hypothetical protein